jgi:hypothetical protein
MTARLKLIRSVLQDCAGTTAVELAIVCPLLVTLVIGSWLLSGFVQSRTLATPAPVWSTLAVRRSCVLEPFEGHLAESAPAGVGAGPTLQRRTQRSLAPWIISQKWAIAATSRSNVLVVRSSCWSSSSRIARVSQHSAITYQLAVSQKSCAWFKTACAIAMFAIAVSGQR